MTPTTIWLRCSEWKVDQLRKALASETPIYTRAINPNHSSPSKVKAVILRGNASLTSNYAPPTTNAQLVHVSVRKYSRFFNFFIYKPLVCQKVKLTLHQTVTTSPFRIKGREECCFIPTTNKHICRKRNSTQSFKGRKRLSHPPHTHTLTHIHTHKDIRTNTEQTSQPRRHIYARHLSETHKVFVLFIPVKTISAMYIFFTSTLGLINSKEWPFTIMKTQSKKPHSLKFSGNHLISGPF